MVTRRRSIKRGAFALVFALLFAADAAQATSVSGKLIDITGIPVPATNALVKVELKNYGSNLPRTATSVIATPQITLTPDAAGNFSGNFVGNDQITPTGTYYRFCVWSNGSQFRCADFLVTGSTLDFDSATPLSTSPTVTAPTGDATYIRTDGGNKPTGNIIPNTGSSQTLGNSGARWEGFFDSLNIAGSLTLSAPLGTASGGTGQDNLDSLTLGKLSLSATTGNDVLLFSGSGVDGVGFDQYGNIRANPGAGFADNWGVFDKDGHGILKVYTDGTQVVQLYSPLPVTSGGTGTNSPGLVAGSNISVTGSWPNQTLAVTGKQGTDANLLTAGTVSGTGSTLCTDANGGATTSGCSSGGVSVVAKVDLSAQTASISYTTAYTTPAAGFYRVSFALFQVDAGSASAIANLKFTQESTVITKTSVANTSVLSGASDAGSGKFEFYADSGTAIQYAVTFSPNTAPYHFDVHVRVEKVE